MLAGVDQVDTSCSLLGRDWALPIGFAPIGAAGMYGQRGECQGARAAQSIGVPFTLSTVGVCPMAEVAQAIDRAPFWFQLYVIRDPAARQALLQQAIDNGCDTLVFTVDMPVPGKRYDDLYPGGLADSGTLAGARRVSSGAPATSLVDQCGLIWPTSSLGECGSVPQARGNRTARFL